MRIVESRIYGTLMVITDFILLGILWVVTSLPVITIFSSTSATCYVIKQWEFGETGSILKIYFTDFKKKFLSKFVYSAIFISLFVTIYLCLENIVKYDVNSITLIVGVIMAYILTISLFFRVVNNSANTNNLNIFNIKNIVIETISHLGSNIIIVIVSTLYIGLIFLSPLFIFLFSGAFWKIICLLLNRKF